MANSVDNCAYDLSGMYSKQNKKLVLTSSIIFDDFNEQNEALCSSSTCRKFSFYVKLDEILV